MVILDTNILIDHLRQTSDSSSILTKIARKIPKEDLAISVLTIQELYAGQSTRDTKLEQAMLHLVSPLRILTYTHDTAKIAGCILRDHSKITFADAGIAATTILSSAKLITLNTKDFDKINELKLLTISDFD